MNEQLSLVEILPSLPCCRTLQLARSGPVQPDPTRRETRCNIKSSWLDNRIEPIWDDHIVWLVYLVQVAGTLSFHDASSDRTAVRDGRRCMFY